jgi:hypothetical protein
MLVLAASLQIFLRIISLRSALVDEGQPPGIKPVLEFLPMRTSSREFGTELFGGQYAFFEGKTLVMGEGSDRAVIDLALPARPNPSNKV